MKYCITGGSGFIGRYFCHRLASEGHHLTVMDLVEPAGGLPHDRFVRGDVRDPQACRAALDGCERVLHLAAAHHDFGIERATYFAVNETASGVLCDAMDDAGIRSICFFSTVAIYGDAPPPHAETTIPMANSPYGESKLAGEKIFEAWTKKGESRRCLVIRPTVTFGPHNFANMYSLIRQIHQRRFVFVGRATNIKSLSYVENLVDAAMHLWDADGTAVFDVYNYVEKPDLTSRQIAETIFASLGAAPPRWGIPMWVARIAALPFDLVIALTGKNIPISTARIEKLFSVQTKFEADKVRDAGFEAKVPLADGIDRMVKWYVEEGRAQTPEWHQPPADVVKRGG